MFHVFDENALDAVLTTLDTASDFITYLCRREALLCRPYQVTASSEEDLLGLYMLNFDADRDQVDFPNAPPGQAMFVDGTYWDAWITGPQRAARDTANAISYAWDELIERSTHNALRGTQEFATSALIADQEPLLRWLSRETRLHRRLFSSFITTMIRSTPPGVLRRRYVRPEREGEPYWVFAIFSPKDGTPYDLYRQQRRQLLEALTQVVKHLHPEAMDIVGLAFGGDSDGVSEDAIYLDARHWNDDLATSARRIYEVTGFFSKSAPIAVRFHEYSILASDIQNGDV
jgi:hypothetical protein